MPRIFAFFAFAVFLVLAGPGAQGAIAATRFVDANDPGCAGNSPCHPTIQAAIDATGPGDTVRVRAGEYLEQLVFEGKNAAPDRGERDRIVVEADPQAPAGAVVLRGRPDRCEGGHAIEFDRSRFVTVRGLTIIGAGVRGITLRGGSRQNEAIHLERNRIFRGGPRECNGGIDVGRGNPGTLIANNAIWGNGRNGIRFRDGRGGSYAVVGNTIVYNGWNGIHITRATRLDLVNNLIAFNGSATGRANGRVGVWRQENRAGAPADVRLLANVICGNAIAELDGAILGDGADAGNVTPTGAEGAGVEARADCKVRPKLFADLFGPDGRLPSADDEFELAVGSVAIDRGVDPRPVFPQFPPEIFVADLDHAAVRPLDGDGDGTPAFDSGAVEAPGRAGPTPTPTATPTPTPSPEPTSTVNPPRIVSEAILAADYLYEYRYPVEATDADPGDVLKYSLLVSPAGMTIDPDTGVITWTPTREQIGDHPVTVAVDDPTMLRDTQAFVVGVGEGPNRPPVIISSPEGLNVCGPGSVIVEPTVVAPPAPAPRGPSFAAPLAETPGPTDPSVDRINWAAASRGATISGGFGFLIDGLASGNETYSTTNMAVAEPLSIDLGAVREIDQFELTLYDDGRSFRYVIDASVDGTDFQRIVDRTDGDYRARQRIVLPLAVPVRYVRIIGTQGSANQFLHLTDEVRVIGSDAAVPLSPALVTIDGVADSGTSATGGQMIELNAGIYRVQYVDGAVSLWPSDGSNGGRTWEASVVVTIPAAGKEYHFGFIHDSLSRFPTAAEAELASAGKFFDVNVPFHARVYLRVSDSAPGDNRGQERFRVVQRSGPNGGLAARVRDAMTRSVLWEQREVAEWPGAGGGSWIATANYQCFGCHVETQASVGLARSRAKVPDLPISAELESRLTDGFASPFWINRQGFVPQQSGASFHPITQTSLWAWAAANQEGALRDRLGNDLIRALNWLLSTEEAGGGWRADHFAGGAEQALYADNAGGVSATHTAGNLQALAFGAAIAPLDGFIPDDGVTVTGNEVAFSADNPGDLDIVFPRIDGVTGIRLTIRDTFVGNKNFVLNEFEAFDGETAKPIVAAIANFSQSGFPISPTTFNGVRNNPFEGWAYSPQVPTVTPAEGLWSFADAQSVSRVRLTQIYGGGHTIKNLLLEVTTDPAPSFASVFTAVPIAEAGLIHERIGERILESIARNAALLSGPAWNFLPNVRTAAQTIIGLNAALPFLSGDELTRAVARIDEADLALRDAQQHEGGWSDRLDGTGLPQALASAQALEALSLAAAGQIDDQIRRGAESLLKSQLTDGSWTAPPNVSRRLAATTWVEIALPLVFEVVTQPATYLYDADAIDPDGDPVSFALGRAPAGMQIDPTTGLVTWDPVLGTYTVDVRANDGRGGVGEQTIELFVTRDLDCDGFTPEQGDCDDTNSTAYPGAIEFPGNGVDEDCDGADLPP